MIQYNLVPMTKKLHYYVLKIQYKWKGLIKTSNSYLNDIFNLIKSFALIIKNCINNTLFA